MKQIIQNAKKADKALSEAVDKAFRIHGDRIQFNMMDLSKIAKETRQAVITEGMDVDEAMKQAVAKYRLN